MTSFGGFRLRNATAEIAPTRALPPEEGSRPATEVILNYGSQPPPLYCWLFGVAMRWMSGSRLVSRIRLLNFTMVFDRLDQLRPPWFPVPALLVAWMAYRVATVGTAAAVVLLFRGRFANE